MKSPINPVYTLLIALLLVACNASKKGDSQTKIEPPKMPVPPTIMTEPSERAGYMVNHLFDGMDGIDTTLFTNTKEREQFLVDFFGIAREAKEESCRGAIKQYFELATPTMDSVALALVGKYFGDPGSPLFDEGHYLLINEEAEKLGILNEAELIRLKSRQKLFSHNQVGREAEDFTFTKPDGTTQTLYNTAKGKELILLFYNPDCSSCQKSFDFLKASETIQNALRKGVQVLCIYPEQNESAWRAKLKSIPPFATIGFDKEGIINAQELYDLRAVPCFYLLDGNKKVLLRDAFPNQLEEYLINQSQQ